MIVVSDASPLISLARINHLHLLKNFFHKITISNDVYNEIVIKGKVLPGSKEVATAAWIAKKEIITSKKEIERLQSIHNLGCGEASTIVLAKEIKADLVIIDERRARVVALSKNLNIIGTMGLLELAFKKSLVTDLREAYQELKRQNVRIDKNLLNASLKRFGLQEL